MVKVKTKYAKCPCCKIDRHKTGVKQALSFFDKQNKRLYPSLKNWGIDSYAELIDSDYYWACDYCLQTGVAVTSSLTSGKGTDIQHLAYFDTEFDCKSCGVKWIFTKAEKKAWYEQYHLPSRSAPDKCLDCRRAQKLHKEQNNVLSLLLERESADLAIGELKQIIEIYEAWGKSDKAAFYRSLLTHRITRGN